MEATTSATPQQQTSASSTPSQRTFRFSVVSDAIGAASPSTADIPSFYGTTPDFSQSRINEASYSERTDLNEGLKPDFTAELSAGPKDLDGIGGDEEEGKDMAWEDALREVAALKQDFASMIRTMDEMALSKAREEIQSVGIQCNRTAEFTSCNPPCPALTACAGRQQ